MDAYLQPLVSCRLNTTIIRQKKEDFGGIEKISYKDDMPLNMCVCVCVCVCVKSYYEIALSQILNTVQIIPHLVCH